MNLVIKNLLIKNLLIASTIVLAGYASWTVTDVRAPAIEMAR